MPKLYSSKEIIKVLKKNGFVFKSQSGSHQKFIKGSLTVIVPYPKKDIPMGTFMAILEQAHLRKQTFKNKVFRYSINNYINVGMVTARPRYFSI